MPIAIWSEEYEVDYPLVDQQHRTLFEMINESHRAAVEGPGSGEADTLLRRLAAYAQEHFRVEETLMASSNYPGLAEHKQAHDGLVAEVQSLLAESMEGRTPEPERISLFLADWLQHHILQEDLLLIRWMKLHPQ